MVAVPILKAYEIPLSRSLMELFDLSLIFQLRNYCLFRNKMFVRKDSKRQRLEGVLSVFSTY